MRKYRDKAMGHTRLLQLQHQSQSFGLLGGFAVKSFEHEYATWLRISSAAMRQWLMSVPFIAVVLAPIYGTLLLHSAESAVLWLRLIEFGFTAPVCAISIYLLHKHPSSPLSTDFMLFALIVVFGAVAMIRWLSAQGASSLSPEIVMAVPLAVAAMGRLRLFLALPTIIITSLLFLALEWFINGAGRYLATAFGTLLFMGLSLIIAISTDRLARREWLAQQIAHLTAMSDAVTGLPNRQWLNRDLATLFATAVRDRQPLAVYLIDLDHFKKLNDSHGHVAGDEALKAVGHQLADFARRPLDLAARFGGEEFVVVLHNPKPQAVPRLGGELVQQIAALGIPNGGAPLRYLTASVGIYSAIPGAKDRPEDFLHEADLALYAAKHAGRNRYQLRQSQDLLTLPIHDSAAEVAIPPT